MPLWLYFNITWFRSQRKFLRRLEASERNRFGSPHCIGPPLTTGTLRLVEPDGTRDAGLVAGEPCDRPRGVAHNVIDVSGGEFVFVEVELLENR